MSNHTLKGFHHFYLGLVFMLLGFLAYWQAFVAGIFVFVLGLILCVDDFVQHAIGRFKPEYKSPLHKLYGFIYSKSKVIRWLNKLADKLFGA